MMIIQNVRSRVLAGHFLFTWGCVLIAATIHPGIADAQWTLQQINLNPSVKCLADPAQNPVTKKAAGDPFVSVAWWPTGQQHFAYLDGEGTIWDVVWLPPPDNRWYCQQINNNGQTPGLPATNATAGLSAATGPSVGVYDKQQHFVYIYGVLNTFSGPPAGTIYDSFYNGQGWVGQTINLTPPTNAPQAAWGPTNLIFASSQGPKFSVAVWDYGTQQHFTYMDASGTVNDVYWDGNKWNFQQVNQIYVSSCPTSPSCNKNGTTAAPLGCGDPFVGIFVPFNKEGNTNGQQHFGYRDCQGTIWDPWYDGPTNSWTWQQINNGGNARVKNAPPAFRGPFIWSFSSRGSWDDQQHFTYVDSNGVIWDPWYDWADNKWKLQQINNGGRTKGPQAVGGVFANVFVFPNNSKQQHIAYRDSAGEIWDSWYDGHNWNLQKINMNGVNNPINQSAGMTAGPPAAGDVFVWTWGNSNQTQQHFTYRDTTGVIWDAYYNINFIGP
jgi:hypothetical protein